jgi:hypothetical protein
MSLVGCNDPEPPGRGRDAGQPVDCTTQPCPLQCKLVRLHVVSGAREVEGIDNWATLRHDGDVVVEAVVEPGTPACAAQVQWSGATGQPVPGQPTQRRFSARAVARHEVSASLGGVRDELTLWVLWARLEIRSTGQRPPNAKAFPPAGMGDGSDKLGAVRYRNLLGQERVAGKIVAVATLEPAGAHLVVSSGWRMRRERISRDWVDGAKLKPGDGRRDMWNQNWVDDSLDAMAVLVPDVDDCLYDTDAPDLASASRSVETHNNFRQWVEWNGETASERMPWHFRARWRNGKVLDATVGPSSIELPEQPSLK